LRAIRNRYILYIRTDVLRGGMGGMDENVQRKRRRLSFKNRMIAIAEIADTLRAERVDTTRDANWYCVAEDWLAAYGIRAGEWRTEAEDKDRVA
jgi:hypothetical protein